MHELEFLDSETALSVYPSSTSSRVIDHFEGKKTLWITFEPFDLILIRGQQATMSYTYASLCSTALQNMRKAHANDAPRALSPTPD
jgi:hypothetical protein